jgi:hypothetical protein
VVICAASDCQIVFEPLVVAGRIKRFHSKRCKDNQWKRDRYRTSLDYRKQHDDAVRRWQLENPDRHATHQRRSRARNHDAYKQSTRKAAQTYRTKAKAYDLLHEAIVPWWDEVKKACQNRSEIPAPPEFTEIEDVA